MPPRRPPVPPQVSSARKWRAWELRVKNPHMTFRQITRILNEEFPAYPLKSDHEAVMKMVNEAEQEYIQARQNGAQESSEDTDSEIINARRRDKRQTNMVVYLIRADNGLVKIGITHDVDARLRALEIASPLGLELIYVITAEFERANQVERRLHTLYEAKRVRGEWFALSDEDIQAIIHSQF